MLIISRRSCPRPVAVLVRSSPGRRRAEECAPRWATTRPFQARAACYAATCSVGGRPTLHGTKSARAERDGIKTWFSRPLETRAADMSRWWCGRASADGVRRSAHRVGPQHNRAKSALRGAQLLRARSADTTRGKKREGRAARNSNVVLTAFRKPCAADLWQCLRGRASTDNVETSAPASGHNTTTPSPHSAAARVLRGRPADAR